MKCLVRTTRCFDRQYKKLLRQYPSLNEDMCVLIERLEQGLFSSDVAIPGFTQQVFKARVASRDQSRGKSGGFRVVYFTVTGRSVFLLTVYTKARQENIDVREIKRLLGALKG